MTEEPLSDEARHEIEQLLANGYRIEAIKVYREATGADLIRSKEAVEAMEAAARGMSDVSSRPIEPSGCAVLVAVTTATLTAVLAYAF